MIIDFTCVCGGGSKNTGRSKCRDIIQVGKRFLLVELLDNANVENKFANEAAVTKAAMQALFDEADASKRIYPTPLFDNPANERADSVFKEYDSGIKAFGRKGIRSMVGVFIAEPPKYGEAIDAWRCKDWGVYEIDLDGNLIYRDLGDGQVRPIPTVSTSIDSKYIRGNNDGPSELMFQFDFDPSFKDAELNVIGRSQLDFDPLSLIDVYGLLDVKTNLFGVLGDIYSAPSLVEVTMRVVDVYGNPVLGLVVADFTSVWNVSTGMAHTAPTVAVESTQVAGQYVLTIPAMTTTEKYRVGITKSRYDMTNFDDDAVFFTAP